jgi:hypothetical protein
VSDVINVAIDRNRISNFFKATVNVTSDVPFSAIEARATKKGSDFGRGIGICLLSDDATTSDGVVNLPSAVKNYTFDAESNELMTDGEYRISIFVLTEDGKWNDGAVLLTSSAQTVCDKNSDIICVKRNGSGTDETYISAYSGDDINNFISEVLS